MFRIMEPMMFRSASELSTTTRGPQTVALSRPLPSPSTIAGALATLILQAENRTPPTGDPMGWYEEVIDILGGKDSIILKGPYLMTNKDTIPYLMTNEYTIYVQYNNGLLPLGELKNLTSGKLFDATKKLNNIAKRFDLGYVDLIGIRLSDMKKAIGKDERGLLYSMRMVDYGRIGVQMKINCNIMVEVLKISNSLERALQEHKIIRLGGEGRLVEVSTNECQSVSESVANSRSDSMRLYVATPILFEASSSLISKEAESGMFFLGSNINKKMQSCLDEVGIKATSIKIAGRLGILGGFSVARAFRKTVYAALQPGSIIEVSDLQLSKEEYSTIYSKGLGLFRDLGYGTVIPISITNKLN